MSANYQRLTPVELSWTSQNVYTGGVGETINVYHNALSEADENPSALTGEKLNYISGYRVPCVSGELSGGAVSVPLASHLPYPASVRGEVAQSSGLLYTTPSSAVQVSSTSNPALLVPAFLGRLPAHHQHHQGNSTAMFTEHNSSELRSAGLVGKPIPSSGCDIGNDAGAGFAPHSLHRAQHHHSSGGIGHQHQLFSQPNGGGGSMRAPSLPAGLMDLSSAPIWSNDPEMSAIAVVPSQVMFAHNHQQSVAAGPQQQAPAVSMNSIGIPHEVNLATRVRHNTWAGPCLDGMVAAMAPGATAGRPINVPLLNGVGEASDCALGRQQQMESILSSGVLGRLDHNQQQQQSNNNGHFASQRSRSAAVYMDGNFPVMPGSSLATDSLAKDNVVGYSMPRHRSFFPGNCANDVTVRNSQACCDSTAAHHSQQRSMSSSNWRSPLPWLADLSRPPPPQPPPQNQWPAHAKSDNPALLMGPPTLIGPKDPRLYPHHQTMPGSGGIFSQVPRLRGGNQQVGFATANHDPVRSSSGLGSRIAAANGGLVDGCQMKSLDTLKMPTARRPDAFFNANLAEGNQAPIDWSYVTNANVRSLMPGNTVVTAPRRRGIDLDRQHQQAFLNSLDHQQVRQVRLASAYQEPATATASMYPSDIFAALCDQNNVPTRVLISTTLVGAIIGRGGKTIRQITNRTGANIVFQPKWYHFFQFSRLPQTSASKEANVKEEVLPSGAATAIGAAPVGGEVTPDLAESQLVLVTGSRKQCSSAVESMLAICYQSTWGRKPGLLEPCLGLLVPQDVFRPFFRDRRYFRSIAVATGARVSFTVARLLSETSGNQQQGTATSEEETVVGDSQRDRETSPTDRIIVVRGSLSAVCAAEAYLSEQIRLVSISRLVPTPLWPLLPIQWLASSEALGHINHLLTLIAGAYWPQSLARQLSRSGSRWCESDASQQPYHHHHRRRQRQQTPEEAVEQERQPTVEEQVEAEESGPVDSKFEQDGAVGDREECGADERKDPETGGGGGSDDKVANEAVAHDEQAPEQVHAKGKQEEDAAPTEDSSNAEGSSASIPGDLDNQGGGGEGGDWQQLAPAAIPKESPPVRPLVLSPSSRLPSDMLQQTLMATFGPSAWLATKGKLYMRMSNNETGAIIGTGASRMRQIMQATGVQMHFSRSNLYVPREESAPGDRRQQTKKTSPCSESSALDDPVTTGLEAEPVGQSPPAEDEEEEEEKKKKQSAEGEPTQEAEEPHSEVREAEGDDVSSASKENGDDSRMPPTGEVDEGDGKADREQEQTTTAPPSKTTTDVYRLLTLTGSLQSQLAAQLRIFHHLESLHCNSSSNSSSSHVSLLSQPSAAAAPAPLSSADHQPILPLPPIPQDQTTPTNRTRGGPVRLSTLICLPRQFLVWLNTRNPSLGVLVWKDTTTQSPLDWLRSEVKRLGSGDETIGPGDGQSAESLLLQTGIHVRQGVASFDAVDALLLDANTLPLEVYANRWITHFVLIHLHCMLALWLCGQSLHYTGGPPPTALLPAGFHPMPKVVGSSGHLLQAPAPDTRSSASRLYPPIGGPPPPCSAGNPGHPIPHPAWCPQSSQQQQQQDSWWLAAVASSLWTAAEASGHLQQQHQQPTPSSAMACSNPPAAATSSSLVPHRWGLPGVLVPQQRHLLSPSAGHSQYLEQQRTSVEAIRPLTPAFPHGIASGGGYPICRYPEGGGQLSLGNSTPGGGARQSWQRAPNAAARAGQAFDVMTSYASGPPLLLPPRPVRTRAPLQHYPTSIAGGLQQQPRRSAGYHQPRGRLNPARHAFNYNTTRRGGDALLATGEGSPPPPVELAEGGENATVESEDGVEKQHQEHEEEEEAKKDADLEISTSVDPPYREEDREGESEAADAGMEDAALPQDGASIPAL